MNIWYEVKNFFISHKTMDHKNPPIFHPNQRGIPVPIKNFSLQNCADCNLCQINCPTLAIELRPESNEIQMDYGKCSQCGICTQICPTSLLENSHLTAVFTFQRQSLVVRYQNTQCIVPEDDLNPTIESFQKLTEGNGLNYREVSAGGNNSIEYELGASFNNLFDSESLGIRAVASPKHADAVLYTGPISPTMEGPLAKALAVCPSPNALVACGTEAISGGVFPQGKQPRTPDLYIAGDPPRPDTILFGLQKLMGRISYSFPETIRKYFQE